MQPDSRTAALKDKWFLELMEGEMIEYEGSQPILPSDNTCLVFFREPPLPYPPAFRQFGTAHS